MNAGGRRQVDDRAGALLLDELAGRRLRAEEHAVEIDRDHRAPAVGRELEAGRRDTGAVIVDHHVEAAEMLDRLGHHLVALTRRRARRTPPSRTCRRPCGFRRARARGGRRCGSRSAPALRAARTRARSTSPIPVPPPVTIVTLPSTLNTSFKRASILRPDSVVPASSNRIGARYFAVSRASACCACAETPGAASWSDGADWIARL